MESPQNKDAGDSSSPDPQLTAYQYPAPSLAPANAHVTCSDVWTQQAITCRQQTKGLPRTPGTIPPPPSEAVTCSDV